MSEAEKTRIEGLSEPPGVPKKIQKRPANPHRMGFFTQISKKRFKKLGGEKWDDRERY